MTKQRAVLAIVAFMLPMLSHPATVMIPAGTRIFGELDELVTSDVKEFSIGDLVNARVWRNIVVDGQTVIPAGAPMLLQISAIQKRRVFGRPGSVELQAISVTAMDGTEIFLDGGYDKRAQGRIALSATLAALVVWPALFIKGQEAVLEPGMVFDAAIPANTNITVPDDQPPTLRLTVVSDLSVDVLYDQIEEKQRDLPLRVTLCDQEWTDQLAVTAVNENSIPAIPIEITAVDQDGDCYVATGGINLKDLTEHFARGINRFSVTAGDETAEIVLDVEM